MSNSTSFEQYTPQQWENILAASLIGGMSLIALAAYVLVIAIILSGLKTFASHPFYAFAISLAISDCIVLILFLFYSVPCTILQRRIFGDGFDIAMGVMCNVSYFSSVMCMNMIAINRYWAVCRFQSYKTIYRLRNVVILLCLIWLFGIGTGLFQAFPCCYLRYYYDTYTYSYDMELWGNAYFIWYDRSVSTVTTATLFVCYSWIILKKPSKTGDARRTDAQPRNFQVRRANLERRLALQSGITAVILVALDISFTIIPEVTSSKWFMLLTSIIYIINNGCSPFIYLIFNRAIRQRFQAMVGLQEARSNTKGAPTDQMLRSRPNNATNAA